MDDHVAGAPFESKITFPSVCPGGYRSIHYEGKAFHFSNSGEERGGHLMGSGKVKLDRADYQHSYRGCWVDLNCKDQEAPSTFYGGGDDECGTGSDKCQRKPDWGTQWELVGRIGFTNNLRMNQSRIPASLSSNAVTLAQLLNSPNGEKMQSALVSTFNPWDEKFIIDNFEKDVDMTVVVAQFEPQCHPQIYKDSWVCAHPHHYSFHETLEERPRFSCDGCHALFRVGVNFLHCVTCNADLCKECNASLKRDYESRQHVLDTLEFPHEANDVMEEYTILSAKNCGCARRRRLTFVQPALVTGEYSIMHAKIMVLEFEHHVRVVISSFNCSEERQWEAMTDSFFVHDFVKRDGQSCDAVQPQFWQDLTAFVGALGCDAWASKLLQMGTFMDFSKLDPNLILILSIPRSVVNADLPSLAEPPLDRVSRIIKGAGLSSDDNSLEPMHMQLFSLGGFSKHFRTKWASSFGLHPKKRGFKSRLKLIFGGCTNIFDKEMIHREYVYHTSQIERSLRWHSKIAWRFKREQCGTCQRVHGWMYLGSHNWSAASWNSLASWEIGVFMVSPVCGSHSLSHDTGRDMSGLPLPCSTGALEKYSWMHEWEIRQCKDEDLFHVRSFYAIIVSIRKNTFTAITLPFPGLDREPRLAPVNVEARLWPGSRMGTLKESTLLQLRALIRVSRDTRKAQIKVLFIERAFVSDEGDAETTSHNNEKQPSSSKQEPATRAVYIPPHLRKR